MELEVYRVSSTHLSPYLISSSRKPSGWNPVAFSFLSSQHELQGKQQANSKPSGMPNILKQTMHSLKLSFFKKLHLSSTYYLCCSIRQLRPAMSPVTCTGITLLHSLVFRSSKDSLAYPKMQLLKANSVSFPDLPEPLSDHPVVTYPQTLLQ